MVSWRSGVMAAVLVFASGCGGHSEPGASATLDDRWSGLTCATEASWTAPSPYGARRGYLGFAPDGTRLAWSAGYYDAVLLELHPSTGRELARFDAAAGDIPRHALLDRDRAWQRDLVGIHALYVADPLTGSGFLLEPGYQSQAASDCAFISEDGGRVFRPACGAGAVWQVLDAGDGRLVTEVQTGDDCTGMTSDQRDGNVLLTLDETLVYWPAGATEPTARAEHAHAESGGIHGLVGAALDPERNRAVTIAADGSVQLYRLPALEPEPTALTAGVTVANHDVYAPEFVVSPVAFSNDGSLLAMLGEQGELVLRRGDSLEPVATIPVSDALAMTFAPDDAWLLVETTNGLAAYACSR